MPYADPARQREYQARWYAQRREEWFAGKTCIDCGTSEALRLDHSDPQTKVSHRVWSWSQERREAELSKCMVRCEPCHKAKTRGNRENFGRAVITDELAQEIRERYAAGGITQAALGLLYSIQQPAISKIVRGLRWK